MKFSLLLCTMNRPELLMKCLDSLYKQSYMDYEIIIVDQSDNVYKGLTEKINTTYVHICRKGLSNARNVALEHVSGDYCCLVDDDAIYPSDWLESIAKSIITQDADVICGRIKDPLTGEYGLNGKNENEKYPLEFGDIQKYGISPCCCFKTSLLTKVKFDDNLGVGRRWGAGEETDTIWSIMELGGKAKYDPTIEVVHPAQNDKASISIEKIVSYNLGFGAMYAKHIRRRNKKIQYLYYRSIFRSTIGTILFWLKRDQIRMTIQRESLHAKKKGYMEYMKSSREGDKS